MTIILKKRTPTHIYTHFHLLAAHAKKKRKKDGESNEKKDK